MPLSLLILDDDEDICNLYQTAFSEEGFFTAVASSLEEAKELMKKQVYHGALTDIFLKNENGVEAMKELIRMSPRTRFFSFTGHESISLAVEAMKAGASSFFPKSIGYRQIVDMVKLRLDPGHDPKSPLEQKLRDLNLIGHSKPMMKVFSQINQFKDVDSTLLITGESGTGKEVVARAIHKLSHRKVGPFEAINCGAIPESLLESELFGHRKGSFTDAKSDKIGLFEYCSGGTLLLDEIGDMPLPLQVKILRVLQEREVRPLGSTKSIAVNPRIIACTHRDLGTLVREGLFRQDLLFRLSVLSIQIPPLRERTHDIPELVSGFIERFGERFSKSITPPTQELMVRLINYEWPGNIRELQNAMERAIVLSTDGHIHFDDVFGDGIESDMNSRSSDIGNQPSLVHDQAKKDFEHNYITNLLLQSKGNISRASRLSGKHRVEIYRLMEKYHIRRSDFLEKDA